MASNQTPNYQLSQWNADDRVTRKDFNADNLKIDAALASLAGSGGAKVLSGTYIGTGEMGVIHYELGVRPKMLVIHTNTRLGNSRVACYVVLDNGFYIRFYAMNYTVVGCGSGCPITFDDSGFNIEFFSVDSEFNRTGDEQQYWVLY